MGNPQQKKRTSFYLVLSNTFIFTPMPITRVITSITRVITPISGLIGPYN